MQRKPAVSAWTCALLQVACLIRVPSEVVKQRAQVSPSSSTLRILSHTLYHEVSSEQNSWKFSSFPLSPYTSRSIPTTLFQLCAFPALFHLFFCSLKWWACYGWGNQASTSPWGMHLMQATLFFSFFYMGYLHLKMREKKGFRFQIPKLCSYLCKQSLSGAGGCWV